MSETRHSSYALERSRRRKQARDRIHLQVLHPIDTPSLSRDPLSHSASKLQGTYETIKLVAVAALVHAMIIAVLYAASDLIGEGTSTRTREVVKVAVVEVPKKVESVPRADVPAPAPVPDFATKAKVTDPIEPTSRPAKIRPKKAVTKAPEPATTEPTKPPARYRPGVSMESTVKGGKGAAMETGNSRMGKSPTTASGPQKGTPARNGKSGGTGSVGGAREGEVRQQRKAANIPTAGSVFVKPKRVKPSKAPYPKTLKAQGIEGDVKIRVTVDASGRVTDVAVVGSSGHKAFDQAARRAAFAEKFRPATRDGKAVPFTLSYSYRFHIEEK